MIYFLPPPTTATPKVKHALLRPMQPAVAYYLSFRVQALRLFSLESYTYPHQFLPHHSHQSSNNATLHNNNSTQSTSHS
jgi:hypothetical protein